MDEGGLSGSVDFFAKGGDVKVDGVGLGVDVVPNAVEDDFSAEDLSGAAGESFDEGKFSAG